MIIRLWKGYHEPALLPLIARSWQEGVLLILCPPLLSDFTFLAALPAGPLEVFGAFSEEETASLRAVSRRGDIPSSHPRPCLGVFTSGTLSPRPRLVLYSKGGVRTALDGIFALFDRARIEHVFAYPQGFHTFGLTLGYVAAHLYGWRLHTPEGKYQSAAHAQRMALGESAVLTLGTPTHFFDLMQFARARGETLKPSYSCIMGGASVSQDLWWRVKNELAIEAPSIGYGCTEAAPGITHLPPGQPPAGDDAIGYPLSSIHARVLAGEGGVEIASGSLCLAIVHNGALEFPRTLTIRDRVAVAADGAWTYRGRLDLLMNRGGAKYSLEAIEKTLHERLGVAAVACSLRDSRLGEDLGLAILKPAAGGEAPVAILDSVQDVLKDVYALRLNTDRTRFLNDFPLNESSKLDRKSIWTLFGDESTL